jgi:hypothetical protein
MRPFLLIFTLLNAVPLCAQLLSNGIFSSPMSIPLTLTSGFGEIRPNHFHSGIDISTAGKSQAVLAIEKGYVSRIKVSVSGYGNALYINHPNGLTSVYAHLSEFNDTLNQYTSFIQQQSREYEVDILLDSSDFPVSRQQFIGWSGNTGSSTGPHLHFEIRDQTFQNVLNPLLFGFGEKDFTAPEISAVSVFPMESYGLVNNLQSTLNIPLVINKKSKKKGLPSNEKTPQVSGWVGFGFQGGDVIGKIQNKTGIFKVQLFVDSKEVYQARFDQFSFDETRSVNAYQDYAERIRTKRKIQRCVLPSYSMIGIYKRNRNRGYFYFDEDRTYEITYVLSDLNENSTRFSFKVKGQIPQIENYKKRGNSNYQMLVPGLPQTVSLPDFEADFQSESLFDTTWLKLIRNNSLTGISPIIELGSKFTPINQAVRIRFKPQIGNDSLKSKCIIARKSGNNYIGIKSTWSNNWLEAETREFGDFQVIIDSIAPTIRVVPQVIFKKRKKIVLKPVATGTIHLVIKDQLSGITSIQSHLNGNWILLEPGDNVGEWKYHFPDELNSGMHALKIESIDAAGNTNRFELQLEKP